MNFSFIRKIQIILGVSIGCFGATSCSAFFGNDTLTILNTNVETDDNGNVIVTINFAEEGKNPLVFTIPKAINGTDGVGIANVVSTLNDDKTLVTITITYTDVNKEPTIITVPVYKGDDGKEVTKVISGFDDEGNTTLSFQYSDGSISETFTINKGKDGKGISDILINSDSNGNYEITIQYTDGTSEKPFYLNSGVGIVSITYDESKSDDVNYCLLVSYTNGDQDEIFVPIPKTNQWFTGNSYPANDLGDDGDFYIIESSGAVYKKTGNTRRYLFSIKGLGSDLTFTVTFDVNGGKWTIGDLTNPEESSTKIRSFEGITYGSYIDLNQDSLKCYNENENLDFKGWWTDPIINPNSGHFTSLTSVTKDLTLYAIWG